jgi:hypothetical protein
MHGVKSLVVSGPGMHTPPGDAITVAFLGRAARIRNRLADSDFAGDAGRAVHAARRRRSRDKRSQGEACLNHGRADFQWRAPVERVPSPGGI